MIYSNERGSVIDAQSELEEQEAELYGNMSGISRIDLRDPITGIAEPDNWYRVTRMHEHMIYKLELSMIERPGKLIRQ